MRVGLIMQYQTVIKLPLFCVSHLHPPLLIHTLAAYLLPPLTATRNQPNGALSRCSWPGLLFLLFNFFHSSCSLSQFPGTTFVCFGFRFVFDFFHFQRCSLSYWSVAIVRLLDCSTALVALSCSFAFYSQACCFIVSHCSHWWSSSEFVSVGFWMEASCHCLSQSHGCHAHLLYRARYHLHIFFCMFMFSLSKFHSTSNYLLFLLLFHCSILLYFDLYVSVSLFNLAYTLICMLLFHRSILL